MRYLVSGLGLLAAATLMLAAGWMNWRFMTSLATDEGDRLALGLASIGIDGLKAALAYLIAVAWDRRQWGYVAVASITYGLLAILSLASSFGFAAENRDGVLSERNSLAVRHEAVAKELGEVEGKLKPHRTTRAAGVIASEIAGLEKEARWRMTKGCTSVRGVESGGFCRRHAELSVELAEAKVVESLEVRRGALRKSRMDLIEKGALRATDRQTYYASMIGVSEAAVRNALLLLLALVMELAAGAGLYLALRPLSGEKGRLREREHLRNVRSFKVGAGGADGTRHNGAGPAEVHKGTKHRPPARRMTRG